MSYCLTSYVEAFRFISEWEKAVPESYFQPRKMAEGDELFEGGKTCKHTAFRLAPEFLCLKSSVRSEYK